MQAKNENDKDEEEKKKDKDVNSTAGMNTNSMNPRHWKNEKKDQVMSSNNNSNNSSNNKLLSSVASKLHRIPSFAIVDEEGVPFMVVGEDAKVTSYFFTRYEEAERILRVARESSQFERTKALSVWKGKQKKGEEVDVEEVKELEQDPWKGARITAVPLDFSLSLTFQSRPGLYFKLSPADQDVEDALEIEGKSDLAENLVPLFYMEDFKVKKKGDTFEDEDIVPLYFRKSELIDAWKASNKPQDDEQPPIKVTELFSVVRTMINSDERSDPDIERLTFIAPAESERKAEECEKAGGNASPYQLGKRILIL